MATDAVKGNGPVTINGFDLCMTDFDIEETATEIDTSSSCDGAGTSSEYTNFALVLTGTGWYSDSRPHHNPAHHNLRTGATVDAEAYLDVVSENRKYTWTDAKVSNWKVMSKKGDMVKVSFTIKSQGDRTNYTVPTA